MKKIFLTSAQVELLKKVIVLYCHRTKYVDLAMENGHHPKVGELIYEHFNLENAIDDLGPIDSDKFYIETEILEQLDDPTLGVYELCERELKKLDQMICVYQFMHIHMRNYQLENNLDGPDWNLICHECDEIVELSSYLEDHYSDNRESDHEI